MFLRSIPIYAFRTGKSFAIFLALTDNQPAGKGKETGSVLCAGTDHTAQDRDADKYDYRDHHVKSGHSRDNKGPRNAANDKSKTYEINYQGHDVASWLNPTSVGIESCFSESKLMRTSFQVDTKQIHSLVSHISHTR